MKKRGKNYWILAIVLLILLILLGLFAVWKFEGVTGRAVSGYNNPVGWFDGIKSIQNKTVGGWICDPDSYSSAVKVNFYLNEPYPQGKFIGMTIANISGEAAIGTYCGGYTFHRFIFKLPEDISFDDGRDYKLYAYAINIPSGGVNPLIGNSPIILKSHPLIGAIRWDFWFNGSEAFQSLADIQWIDRIPLTSNFTQQNNNIFITGGTDSQEKMSSEINAAERGGIDYWAFDYYSPSCAPPNGCVYLENRSYSVLNLYLNNPLNNKVKFALILFGGSWQPWNQYTQRANDLITLFKKSNYQKINGRPIIFFFGSGTAYSRPKGAGTPTVVEILRNAAQQQGIDPYFVLLEFTASQAVATARDLHFDAISSYGNPLGTNPSGNTPLAYPYSHCLDVNNQYRQNLKQEILSGNGNFDTILTMNAGWDNRPLIANPVFGYQITSNVEYCTKATPSELEANLKTTLDWLDDVTNSNFTKETKSVLIYAWNEFGEGGWIAPTYGDNYARLDAIRELVDNNRNNYFQTTQTNTVIQTCTSFSYSSWTSCNSSALQSRTITSNSPSGCTGGASNILVQQCSPPCTLSNWQSSDSACLSSGTLTRTWTKIGNCNQTIGLSKSASEPIPCTYIPNVVTCTNFTYSDWGTCLAEGVQNRSLISSSPTNCQGGNPILTQTCNYTSSAISQDNNPSQNNDESSDSNPGTNQDNSGNQNISTTPNSNPSQNQTINLSEGKKEVGAIKTFFIKLICRISNLFSSEGYSRCVSNYLE